MNSNFRSCLYDAFRGVFSDGHSTRTPELHIMTIKQLGAEIYVVQHSFYCQDWTSLVRSSVQYKYWFTRPCKVGQYLHGLEHSVKPIFTNKMLFCWIQSFCGDVPILIFLTRRFLRSRHISSGHILQKCSNVSKVYISMCNENKLLYLKRTHKAEFINQPAPGNSNIHIFQRKKLKQKSGELTKDHAVSP